MAYRAPIPARHGTPPYSVVLIAGLAPPGPWLSPDRRWLQGIPRKTGLYRFEIMPWDRSKPPLRRRTEHVVRIVE